MKLFDEYNEQELDAIKSHEDEAYFLPLPPELLSILQESVCCGPSCSTTGCFCIDWIGPTVDCCFTPFYNCCCSRYVTG